MDYTILLVEVNFIIFIEVSKEVIILVLINVIAII